jgi:AcrR family transcriptional regulator
MPRKTRTDPRKSAVQQRSQMTVDAMLEATARILLKSGYDNASTNKIAQEAGVSIGSLYQYFPGKEALVAAVIDQHMEEMMDVARVALAEVMPLPIEAAVRKLVEVIVAAHRVNPTLHRVLVEQVPRTGRLRNVEALDREAYELVRAYLEIHRDEVAVKDLDLAAFICQKTVETLAHTAVVNHSDSISGKRRELFLDEVTRMIVGYLKGQ